MKSLIKIDISDDGLPVLKIRLATDQSDVRDKLLNRFFRHTETSNLLTFKIVHIDPPITIGGGCTDIEVYPVKDVILSNDHQEAVFGVIGRDELIRDYVINQTEEYDTSKH